METKRPVDHLLDWADKLLVVKSIKRVFERLEAAEYGTRHDRLLGYLNLYEQCERLYGVYSDYVGTFAYEDDEDLTYRRLVLEVHPNTHHIVIEKDDIEGSFTVSSLLTSKGWRRGSVTYDSQVIALMQTAGSTHHTHLETMTPIDADLHSEPEPRNKFETKSRILPAEVANEWADYLKTSRLQPDDDHFMMIGAVYYGQQY